MALGFFGAVGEVGDEADEVVEGGGLAGDDRDRPGVTAAGGGCIFLGLGGVEDLVGYAVHEAYSQGEASGP